MRNLMGPSSSLRLICCTILSVSIAGCVEEPPPEELETPEGQALISPSGGLVQGPLGAELDVPEGAVAQEMTIVIQEALERFPDPMNLEIQSPVFAFMPHGMTFTQPVKVRLPLPSGNAEDFAMVTSQPDGGWVHVHPARAVDGYLEVEVTHFSFYAIIPSSSLDVDASDEEITQAQYCGNSGQPCCPRQPQCEGATTCVPTVCTQNCVADSCFEPECESQCRWKLPIGFACGGDDECTTGMCIDGVCCDSTCEGQCEACNVAGFQGSCAPVTGDPRGDRPDCGNEFDPQSNQCGLQCDGINPTACTPQPAGSICDSSCDDGIRPPTGMLSICDGSGSCSEGYPFSCAPYVCDGNTGTCATTCEDVSDCADGAMCGDTPNRCLFFTPHGACNGAVSEFWYWSEPDEIIITDCEPYACNDEFGGCMHRCTSTLDCAIGYHCDAYTTCVIIEG